MKNSASIEAEGVAPPEPSDGLDLLEISIILLAARKRIVIFTVTALILGVVVSILLKPTFTGTALIMPPQQTQSASSMLGQLGSLASLATAGALKNPSDIYVGILGSRTIADNIITQFHLKDIYKTKTDEDTRRKLKSNSRFLTTNDGLIHILTEDHSAQRASEIANAYVDQLYAMNSHLAITEAAQRRLFFDEELANEKTALSAAEEDLKQTSEKTGVIQLSGQTASMIRSIADIRAQIAAQEVHIQSLHTFATDQNPEEIRAQQEVSALRSQLAQLEKDPRNAESGTDFPAGQVPAVSLQYARKVRELKYHEALYELLSKQYQAARIDEAKAAPLIQIVDRAVPPDEKSGPPRVILTLGFGALGLFLGCIASLGVQTFRKLSQVPLYASKLVRLRGTLRRGTPHESSAAAPSAR